nr:hypothetical protein [uncultured Ligilactobacillus sp.]
MTKGPLIASLGGYSTSSKIINGKLGVLHGNRLKSYEKKIYKVIKRLITVILLILLFIAFLGGKRWYDFNHTYSLEKKINYLSDPWYFSYGFPQKMSLF